MKRTWNSGWQGLPGIKVPFVQPSLDTFLRKLPSQLFNGRFIDRAIEKERRGKTFAVLQ
jgi:hypothetical protein